MRAIILVSALILANAINPEMKFDPGTIKLFATIFVAAGIMDILEWFKRI